MFKIVVIVWMIVGTAFAGIAVMTILSVPALAAHDMAYIPYAAIAGFLLAIPVAYVVAGRISRTLAT